LASDYGRNHQNPANLLIHMVAVPLFVASFAYGIWLLISDRALLALLCFLGPIASLAAQGIGHKMEPVPAEPFRGPLNFLQRIFLEQFYRYWVFVFSGAWFRTIQASRGRHGT
jgi:hypothetical protein